MSLKVTATSVGGSSGSPVISAWKSRCSVRTFSRSTRNMSGSIIHSKYSRNESVLAMRRCISGSRRRVSLMFQLQGRDEPSLGGRDPAAEIVELGGADAVDAPAAVAGRVGVGG